MERRILLSIMFIVIAATLIEIAHGASIPATKKPPQCNCNCPGAQLTCGKDPKTGALLTFKNPCQMICQNCIYKEKWVIVKQGECKPTKRSLSPSAISPAALKVASAGSASKLPSKAESAPRVKTLSIGG